MAENLAISAETASNSDASNCSMMWAALSGSKSKRKPASFCNWFSLENSVASELAASSMAFIQFIKVSAESRGHLAAVLKSEKLEQFEVVAETQEDAVALDGQVLGSLFAVE